MGSQRHQTSWKKVLLSLPNADQSQRGKERPAEASTALSTPRSALVSKDWCLQGWHHSAGHGSWPLPGILTGPGESRLQGSEFHVSQ